MQFGQVEKKELKSIDFSLGKDRKETQEVLGSTKKKKKTKVYVGCAKWGRPDWIGKIYPKGTKAANFLDEYGKQFNCIEFNAVYYRLPPKSQIDAWYKKVPDDFIFCPKFTDVITHIRRLKNAEKEVQAFLDTVYALGEKLGPVFLMPHPQMGIKHKDTILDFIKSLPKDLDLFVEFRHPEWYLKENFEPMCNEIQKLKKGMVITDAAGRRDCVHMRLTTPSAFIRFVGNSLDKTDYERIDEWVKRIKKWMNEGLERCYFFMHQHEELYSPELCKYLIEQLNKHCKLDIKVPQFVTQKGLF